MFKTRFISMLVLLMTAVTGAWAQEQSETIATTAKIVEGTHFTISSNGNYADGDGMCADFGITVTPKNGETITKVVISCTYGRSNVNDGNTSVSSGTKEITNGGETITVTGVNASTFTFTCSDSYPQFGQFVVYYTEAPVAVTGVTLAPTSATLTLGETETVTLIPTVLPAEATDKSVTWSSSNEAVATVTDGVVTAVAAGTATITVTTTDGAKTATCAVTVAAPAASTYTVTLKEGTEDATSWTIAPAEATTTGVAAGTEVKATYGGVKKVKSVKAVKKAGPVTYTALSGGEVLHVGDIIEVPVGQEWYINNAYYLMPNYNPFTVVSANITGDPDDPEVGITVTEAADGAYYVIKNKDGEWFFTGEYSRLPVTGTSDGIYVTYNGVSFSGAPKYTFSVHEP